MRTDHRRGSVRRALLAAITLLLVLPGLATAHAELDTTSPADGDTVEGTPAEISADFTDTLTTESTFELLDAAGAVVAEGGVDPGNDQRMVLDPPELEPGAYEIRWLAIPADGHLERGTYGFTVTAAATEPPTPSGPPSGETSGSPDATAPLAASPSATASSTPDPSATASTTDVLIPIVAAVVILAVLGGYLLSRRRATPRG